jgi:glycosyltransferase involved in cell wall biosynthesis
VSRAVILVGNPARPYSRAIRVGRTLVAAGFDVEIAATWQENAPELERDGACEIRRFRPIGRFAAFAARGRPPERGRAARGSRLARIVRARRARFVEWVFWPQTVRGWWAALARDLAPADLYHACGLLALPAALAARGRDRRAGRRSRVIYDVIDITMESNSVLRLPRLVRDLLGIRERRWARGADAWTAINEPFAQRAVERWRLPRRPIVVPNYPEPWNPPAGASPDLIRAATGLPASTRICLFWGRLGPGLGVDEATEAVLSIPDAAMVLLGFGRGWEGSRALDEEPRFAGRHATLPAVHPDDLPAWIASADVALVTLPPLSYNQRHTTPNKFLEAIAGGTPIVLGPDLPTMAELLEREDLGRVARSMASSDIAAAIRSILEVPPAELAAWRARIRETARARYSWPIAAAAYREVVGSLGIDRS